MMGSDYPFPLGEQPIGSLITDSPHLNKQQKQKMLSNNALDFFNLN